MFAFRIKLIPESIPYFIPLLSGGRKIASSRSRRGVVHRFSGFDPARRRRGIRVTEDANDPAGVRPGPYLLRVKRGKGRAGDVPTKAPALPEAVVLGRTI